MNSPLLFPVKLDGNRILVLDETLLPLKEEYIALDSLDKALWVLSQMKTRSLGQVLLFFYCCVLFERNFSIDEISRKFKQRRPTFDFLFLAQILKGQMRKIPDIREAANSFICAFDKLRRKRSAALADILPADASILTICNVNGELIYLYQALTERSKRATFIVCETRPYLQGVRLSFWELRKNNIPALLICDNQAALLMRRQRINCVVTGADRATAKGDVINKVGTYSLACLAKYFNIPFYSLTQYPRDIDVETIPIEERPQQEAFMFLEGDYSHLDAFYPAFDITPAGFVTKSVELAGRN
ncbi:MAG: hypothetical protein JSV34_00890 [Candidatus Omnitrophota bacterium]|nr:MAG: hypothetical protein JSV34_00890 [Candidatus Omnitrophota bacterium]